MTYSVNDIVGKTLYAAKRVPVRKIPSDNAPVDRYIEAGNMVGVVYAYIMPKAGRNANIYWQFEEERFGQITTYYVEHKKEYFNKGVLKDQFPAPKKTWQDTATNAVVTVGLFWAGVKIIQSLINKNNG